MKKIVQFTLGLLLIAALPISSLQAAPAIPPKEAVKTTVDEIIKIVEALPGDANKTARRAKIRKFLDPRFDFQEMSQRSLGSNWEGHSADEQAKFVTIFSELLAKTYLAKIELVKKDTVKVEYEDIRDTKALVKTTVQYKGDTFPIDYKLLNESGEWRVYDVIVENIGLVANYRNEFAGIIRKDGFDGLLEQLKQKNDRLQ